MKMDGAELVLHKPVEARRHGIEIVHQDLALCNNLTAAANVFLGRELRSGIGPFSVLDYAEHVPARRRDLQGTEIRNAAPRPRQDRCRAASARRWPSPAPGFRNAKIVLMDEPTAAISVRQVAEVLNLIRLLRDQGIAVVLISHRMPDVFDRWPTASS